VFLTVQRLFQPKIGEGKEDGGGNADDDAGKKKFTNGIDDKEKQSKKYIDPTNGSTLLERIPYRPHQMVSLGKKSCIKSVCFLPDGMGLKDSWKFWGSLLLFHLRRRMMLLLLLAMFNLQRICICC